MPCLFVRTTCDATAAGHALPHCGWAAGWHAAGVATWLRGRPVQGVTAGLQPPLAPALSALTPFCPHRPIPPPADPDWEGTLFAPSNCAIKALLADLEITEKLLLSNGLLLDTVLSVR